MSLPTRPPRPRGIHVPSIPEEPVFPINFRPSACQVSPECGGDLHDVDHLHPIPPASPPEIDSVKMAPPVLRGTADVDRIEAPVTAKAYMMCAFASFGGIYFGYDIGWIS